jgi:hypothetical protein
MEDAIDRIKKNLTERHLTGMERDEKCTKILAGNPERTRPLGRRGRMFVICIYLLLHFLKIMQYKYTQFWIAVFLACATCFGLLDHLQVSHLNTASRSFRRFLILA